MLKRLLAFSRIFSSVSVSPIDIYKRRVQSQKKSIVDCITSVDSDLELIDVFHVREERIYQAPKDFLASTCSITVRMEEYDFLLRDKFILDFLFLSKERLEDEIQDRYWHDDVFKHHKG